jgi:hypothetical protein
MAIVKDELDVEQQRRFLSVVNSRVRLLGESYSTAHDAVALDGAGNYNWIMTGASEPGTEKQRQPSKSPSSTWTSTAPYARARTIRWVGS